MSRFGLGIDAGGTFTKLFAVSSSGKLLGEDSIPTRPEAGPKDYVRRLAAGVRSLENRLGRRADAACLAIAGDVDSEAGVIRRSPNLRRFERFPLSAALRKALKRGVAMHNDANMAAWGCYVLELGRKCPDLVAITLGTGVGGGVILGGRLHLGATGSAGEIGHMRVHPGGELCNCGARGCLEAYAGSYGILRHARRLLAESPRRKSVLRSAAHLDPKAVFEAARAGDWAGRAAYRRVGESLGVGIVNLVYLFNPGAVVIAGGVSRAAPLFMAWIRRALAAESFRVPFGAAKVVIGRSAQLGAFGAALYALEEDA
ncbi:MAG TPA: ROK family protein [Elusimicrobiota bacterium]|jgi:glucokinase|nr:ROK family protein [Elusimicrobiota bacterium]